MIYQIKPHTWYGLEEFGGAINFDATKAKDELRTLALAINDVTSAINGFTDQMKAFNQQVSSFEGLAVLVKALEDIIAKKARDTDATNKNNKAMLDANAIINERAQKILNITNVLDKNNELLRTRTIFLDKEGKAITVVATAEGKLLSLRERDTIATAAQLRAQQSLNEKIARAATEYERFQSAVRSGQYTILSTTPKVNSALNQTQEVIKGISTDGQAFTATLTRVNGQMVNFSGSLPAVGTGLKQVDNNIKQVTASWQTFIRIVAVQLVHRAVSALIQEFREAVRMASEFEIKISEVRTISQQAQLSTEGWANGLRKLSNEFGIDVLDQTEAAYQTLSNQVAHGAEVFGFLTQANRLAIATVSDTSTAVQALTALINSYSLSTEDASKLSAQLFKTVELGRLRLKDLSESIGNVTILSSKMNVSVSEVLASLVTLTRQGVNADEAMTLLRNVFLALIRPTKEMKQLFRELGVTSGEQLIAQRGLAGAFALLEEKTRGSTTQLAEYFGRIRGIVGASAFAGKGLQLFTDALDEITKSSDSFNKAVGIGFESTAKKVEIAANKIRNAFEKEFGEPVLEIILKVSEAIGGLDRIIRAIGGAIDQTKRNLDTLPEWMKLVVAYSAIGIVNFKRFIATITETERIEDKLVEQEKVLQEVIARRASVIDDSVSAIKAFFDDEYKAVVKSISSLRSEANKIIDEQAKADALISKNIRLAYDGVITELTNKLKDFDNALRSTNQLINNTTKQIEDVRANLGKQLFDIKFEGIEDSIGQIKLLEGRIQQLQGIIAQNTTSVSVSSIKIIDEAFKEIEAREKQLFTLTKKADSEHLKAKDNLLKALQDEKSIREDIALNETKRTNDILDKRKALLKAAKDSERRTTVSRGTGGKLTVRSTDPEVRKAQREYDEALAASANKQADINEKLTKNLEKQKDLKNTIKTTDTENVDLTSRLTDLSNQQVRILQQREKALRVIAKKQEEEKASVEASTKAFKEQFLAISAFKFKDILAPQELEDQTKKAKEEIAKIANFADFIFQDKNILGLEGTPKLLTELANRVDEINKVVVEQDRIRRLNLLEEEAKKKTEAQKKLLDEQAKRTKDTIRVQEIAADVLREQFARQSKQAVSEIAPSNALDLVKKAFDKLVITPTSDTLAAFNEAVKEFQKGVPGSKEAVKAFQLLQPNIDSFFRAVTDNIDETTKLEATRAKAEEEAKKAQEEVKKYQTLEEKKSAERNALLAKVVDQQTESRDIWLQILEEQKKLTARQGFARGGPVGTDTIPAMLSPGEFVVNARATKQFYSQLVAMNSNIPRLQAGGPVTNIGDLNVSMQSSGNEGYDVVKLGKLLRREIRRGTLKLN